ncbi:MAG: Rod shape-determining protein MreC [uncultured Rubrobacteraceae bacterium]|uniref:Cell shape-determining protein MreC n=1 Tax=uncultured Rubrobacteraceae bacterium TaxID=349277 RepID=A0A6J4S4Z9_9ACTN|nr:MAG: Rod shape-determining protein MreC [uncultured Rubrobacteraceae bacterium]
MGRRKSSAASGFAALCALCVVSLALFTVYVKEGDCSAGADCGPLHTVQLGAAEVLQPVRGVVGALFSPIRETADSVGNAFDDSEEERLRAELRDADALAARSSQLQQENERLRGLLEGQRTVYEYGPLARVVAPVGDQFSERIVLDVGTENGIQDDQPVVVGENTLVGRTTNVSRHTAQVMLITDRMFAAGVRIVPPAEFDPAAETVSPAVTAEDVPYGQGKLGTALEGYFGVDYVDRSLRAEEGDYVVTSGRAAGRDLLDPPGLYVGTVESAASQDIEQFKKIVVDPAMNPDDLEDVRVITGWAGKGS